MTLAEKCYDVRQRLHISQKELARMIATNQTEVSFIERGFVPRDVVKIEKIERLYAYVVSGTR